MIDTMIKDGLWDAFNGYHMGNTAENVENQWQITREQQDNFAMTSQNRGRGRSEGRKVLRRDRAGHRGRTAKATSSSIRTSTFATAFEIEMLTKLRPAFAKDGSVTAGNASGINDGAAAVVLMTVDEAAKRGVTPMARIASWGACRRRSRDHGFGPDPGQPQGARGKPAGRSTTST